MCHDVSLSEICTLTFIWQVFSPAKVTFAGVGVLLSAAKDARASQDTLIDIFERIEMIFRRLEVYTRVLPTTEMMDIIIQIMVEVLSILGVATKEIKQGRLKKYAKKLIGRNKIKDALKRLNKLTQEEARMASAQNLKITQTVDERVRGVADTVVAIDNRVVTVDDRVKMVDNKLTRVIAEFETHGSVNSWLSNMQAPISTAEFANHLPYNLAEARGTMDPSPNFVADDCPIAVQQFESAALSAHVTSDSDAQMVPVKKPFKCPHCPFSSARKYNLKTHIDTHKEASKRCGCSTCSRRFTRKLDLRRHRENIHGDRMPCSASSASGDSSRHFDLRPDLSQHRTTTVSGDEQLTSESSLHPGPSSATGLEDLMAGSMRLGERERETYRNHEGSSQI